MTEDQRSIAYRNEKRMLPKGGKYSAGFARYDYAYLWDSCWIFDRMLVTSYNQDVYKRQHETSLQSDCRHSL